MQGSLNTTLGAGATVTSTRYSVRPGHTQITFDCVSTVAATWQAYACHETEPSKRVALFVNGSGTATARSLSAGVADMATVAVNAAAIEIDVISSGSAGTFSWAYREA